MGLKTSDTYQELVRKARWCHENRRNVFHVNQDDVALARLYSHGFRTQTIGAVHACREALIRSIQECGDPTEHRLRAIERLHDIESLAMVPVPRDFRALAYTLYRYNRFIAKAIRALEQDALPRELPHILGILERFTTNLERITCSHGICTASDTRVPDQGSFDVPGLGITIVPLVYGDQHSWNLAYLKPESAGNTTHRHQAGVEIHLGFSPLHGHTILGDCAAEVNEGYAMPIPARTDHGFDTLEAHDHFLPFIFGSLQLSGWGIFFDVEPQQKPAAPLPKVDLLSESMNGSVHIDREIEKVAAEKGNCRELLIPASATASGPSGALELWIARAGAGGMDIRADSFRILSVRKGAARLEIGPASAELGPHDHAGIPAELPASLVPLTAEPVVFLEANLVSA